MAGMSMAAPATDRRKVLTAVSRATGLGLTRILVPVTMEHFHRGIRCDAGNCMFKHALADVLGPGFSALLVDTREVRFSYRPSRLRFAYATPVSLASQIKMWDEGATPEEIGIPFSYVLRAPRVWSMSAPRSRTGPSLRVLTPAQRAAADKGMRAMHAGRGITPGVPREHRPGEIPPGRMRQYGIRALARGLSVNLEN